MPEGLSLDSIPGVLKNAIDWASRPPDQPFAGKPAAIMGASPEVMIASAQGKFDEAGQLTDERTGEFIRQLLVSLRDWTRRLRR